MSPTDAAKVLRTRARAVTPAMKAAHRLAMQALLSEAKQASSGTFKSAQLRRMGYPYAQRNPQPPQNPAILNKQTGRIKAGWQTFANQNINGDLVSSLFNTAPEAVWFDDSLFPHGTKWAIARPIQNYLRRKVWPLYRVNTRLLMEYALNK